jgi:hypothetical protein
MPYRPDGLQPSGRVQFRATCASCQVLHGLGGRGWRYGSLTPPLRDTLSTSTPSLTGQNSIHSAVRLARLQSSQNRRHGRHDSCYKADDKHLIVCHLNPHTL